MVHETNLPTPNPESVMVARSFSVDEITEDDQAAFTAELSSALSIQPNESAKNGGGGDETDDDDM